MIQERNVILRKEVEELIVNIITYDDSSKQVTYEVVNTPICQFDQHSRARVEVTFFDYKVANTADYVLYAEVYDRILKDKKYKDNIFDSLVELETIRNKYDQKQAFNLMSRNCSYKVKQSINSLKGQMMRRLKFCEESFIAGLHWKLKQALVEAGCKEAEYFLPGCDLIKECDYSSADYLAQSFSCLFAGCNRWPDKNTGYASFNHSCTTAKELETQMNISIVKSEYEIQNNLR